MSLHVRPFDVVVFSGDQIVEEGWIVAVGRGAVGGIVIMQADTEDEARRFAAALTSAIRALLAVDAAGKNGTVPKKGEA